MQLKALKLKELADDIKKQRQMDDAKGKKDLPEQTDTLDEDRNAVVGIRDQQKMDEMWVLDYGHFTLILVCSVQLIKLVILSRLAQSFAAEEEQGLDKTASTSDEDEDIILVKLVEMYT